jgi:gamma-glutamylcyclotransferase (GGCT)/AIG2-like uncharacterized protein YtfP
MIDTLPVFVCDAGGRGDVLLPDHELLAGDAADGGGPRLRARRGSVVRGALRERGAPGDAALRESEVILPDGSLRPALVHADAAGAVVAPLPPVDAVFVYGTLLRGERNAHVLHGPLVVRVTDAALHGATLHETPEPYPVMRLGGDGVVHGELAVLSDVETALGPLDALETFTGYGRRDRMYHRTLVTVRTADGARLAWTYVAGEAIVAGARIGSGRWRV